MLTVAVAVSVTAIMSADGKRGVFHRYSPVLVEVVVEVMTVLVVVVTVVDASTFVD